MLREGGKIINYCLPVDCDVDSPAISLKGQQITHDCRCCTSQLLLQTNIGGKKKLVWELFQSKIIYLLCQQKWMIWPPIHQGIYTNSHISKSLNITSKKSDLKIDKSNQYRHTSPYRTCRNPPSRLCTMCCAWPQCSFHQDPTANTTTPQLTTHEDVTTKTPCSANRKFGHHCLIQ